MQTGIELIAEERQRQITVEGWTADHDDEEHAPDTLAKAAACYCLPHHERIIKIWDVPLWHCLWPFQRFWFKSKRGDRLRDLVKAGALIVAEIDKLQRSTQQTPP